MWSLFGSVGKMCYLCKRNWKTYMEKRENIKNVKLTAFPEEVDEENGLKVYGEMSYETLCHPFS